MLRSLVFFLCFFLSSCRPYSRAPVKQGYGPEPYYVSTCEDDLSLILTQSEIDHSPNLFKVLLIDMSIYVKVVPSFMLDFTKGLEAKGWHVFDAAKMSGSMINDLGNKTGRFAYPDIIAIYNAEEKHFRRWPELYTAQRKKGVLIHWPDEVWEKHLIDGMKVSSSITDAIFPRYHHGALKNIKPFEPRCFKMPHGATKNFFRKIPTQKIEKVLISGYTDPHYALRYEASRHLVNGNTSFVQRIHPGYSYMPDPEKEAKDYSNEISKYLLAISGGGISPKWPTPIVFAKHFEIPAAGTALLTDEEMIPYLRELGFEPGAHYIPTRRDNLLDTVHYWLDIRNRDELLEITKRGQELVMQHHRNEQRIEVFDRIAVNLFYEKQRKGQNP